MNKKLFSKMKSMVPEPLKRIWIVVGLILASPIILLILIIAVLFGGRTTMHSLTIQLSNWKDKSEKEKIEGIKIDRYRECIHYMEADWNCKKLNIIIELNKKESNIQKFHEVRDEFLLALKENGYEIVDCEEEFNEK